MIWTAQRCRCHAEWWPLLPNGALPEFFGCFTAYSAVRQPKNFWALQETGPISPGLPVWAQPQPPCVGAGGDLSRNRIRPAGKTVSDTENFADLCLEALP